MRHLSAKRMDLVPSRSRGLLVHLRGHVLLFDQKPASQYEASAGVRLLLIAMLLEAIRLGAVRWFYPALPLLILIPLFLICALLAVRFGAGLRLSQIGFHPWRKWTATEKSYFVQLLVIANVVFPLVFAARLQTILGQPSALGTVVTLFVPYLFFGFYQEVVYRGMLQSELVRRWGSFTGVLAANILYTFGPLHWYYFSSRASLAVPMFASIFAIGLFFGVLFRRSGNLWIVAIIHGIGNAYIVGSLGPTR
jgi:membrane protease YdiL (CAAX protease family)